jgi:hypothetical protein
MIKNQEKIQTIDTHKQNILIFEVPEIGFKLVNSGD